MGIIVIQNDNHCQSAPGGRADGESGPPDGGRPHRLGDVIVVNRFRVPSQEAEEFRAGVAAAHAALAARPGFVDGRVGRNVDDPELWLLTTRWENVGSYRRALSAYDVKVTAVPLLSQAIDEPSAYELVGDEDLNESVPRGG